MISRVDFTTTDDFFKFSEESDSKQMLKKFELKICLNASHVDGLKTLNAQADQAILAYPLKKSKLQNGRIKVLEISGDSYIDCNFSGLTSLKKRMVVLPSPKNTIIRNPSVKIDSKIFDRLSLSIEMLDISGAIIVPPKSYFRLPIKSLTYWPKQLASVWTHPLQTN
ncbi:unnamed protein product [Ambrosiozyma monospora]|uniref:Unnamed protein product n=1 Tax=Ambrosiozyma monospora TaxID=43982 RepID=A0ACB5U8E1_AMBMO|nr:unnamed protein product [Ambrosiozyma monospora]